MKSNIQTMENLIDEVTRIENSKLDLVVSPDSWEMIGDGNSLQIGNHGDFPLTEFAHGQLASKLNIPKRFYDGTLSEIPELRQETVNRIKDFRGKNQMIRTLDNRARAVLSDRFKPIDHMVMLQGLLPVVAEHPDMQLKSLVLTETRLYIQAVFPRITGEVTVGDVVQAGVTIRNSEVGAGSYEIESMVYRLRCLNGMIGNSLLRKYHSGARLGTSEGDYGVFRDDTIEADMIAFQKRTRDILNNAVSQAGLTLEIARFKSAKEDVIEKPQKVIENVTKRFGIPDRHHEEMLLNMGNDAGFNRWGLANSLTALARDIDNRGHGIQSGKSRSRNHYFKTPRMGGIVSINKRPGEIPGSFLFTKYL